MTTQKQGEAKGYGEFKIHRCRNVECPFESSHVELLEALRKCRVALTPHVFIDNDAREARNLADKVINHAEGR